MKYFIICFFFSMSLGIQAQTTELSDIRNLMSEYNKEKSTESLNKAAELTDKLLEKASSSADLQTQLTATKVYLHKLTDTELEDPISFSDKLLQSFTNALNADTDMNHRYQLLVDVYTAKSKMLEYGAKAYDEKEYETAFQHYENALEGNALEVNYPQHTPLDTTIIFTSAVFAKMAGRTDEAVSKFQKIIDMEYDRKDAYSYLIEIYKTAGNQKKAASIENLMNLRYPE